ncbi:hypothetical protein PR048_024480 [Dryococelus australis]|uniref:Uncharacterized protein n=1 Tax=Dryococelus australis TaxID=614101 RepID=A0ABQ9GNR9_9NEOP|nr:hypothetical protein PR048_024480 [Dryococelus australis]
MSLLRSHHSLGVPTSRQQHAPLISRWRCPTACRNPRAVTDPIRYAGSVLRPQTARFPFKTCPATGTWRRFQTRRRAPSGGSEVCFDPLTSHKGEPGSIPGGGFLHVGVVPDDAPGWRVSSGISRFPRPFIPALHPYSPRFTILGSQYLACTPVQCLALNGDGALGERGSVVLIAPVLLGGKKFQAGGDLKLALGWTRLEHVRDGDGRVAVGEVRVVPTPADRNAEAIAGDAGQGHVVVLPHHPFPALQHNTSKHTRHSSAYWSLICVFIGCCPAPGSYGIREVFPCKSAIGSESSRAGLIKCVPIAKPRRVQHRSNISFLWNMLTIVYNGHESANEFCHLYSRVQHPTENETIANGPHESPNLRTTLADITCYQPQFGVRRAPSRRLGQGIMVLLFQNCTKLHGSKSPGSPLTMQHALSATERTVFVELINAICFPKMSREDPVTDAIHQLRHENVQTRARREGAYFSHLGLRFKFLSSKLASENRFSFSTFETDKGASDKDDTAKRIKCDIAAKRKILSVRCSSRTVCTYGTFSGDPRIDIAFCFRQNDECGELPLLCLELGCRMRWEGETQGKN